MYRPQAFVEDRRDVLVEAMRGIGFAAIVTPHEGGIEVTHVPVLVRVPEAGSGGSGTGEGGLMLDMHFARGNPHWKAVTEARPSVAIFQGPHAYVHPGWYPSKQEHGKVVPTWTYIAVHAHGSLRVMEDEAWLRAHLDALTQANEAAQAEPWAVSDAPETFIGALSRGIVGLRLEVERLEGAWKLNQHKAEGDREGTRKGLAGAGAMGEELAQALGRRIDAAD